MTIGTRVAPFGLKPWFSERVWGKSDLKPWFDETGTTELVGEAWLTGPQCVVESGAFKGLTLASVAEKMGGEFPLLVKILFPADKLSVQVHPDDAQAKAMGETRGKTECWYVLEAEPDATVALGLKAGVGAKEVAASVESGTMELLLEHVPVSVGDMLFVDAGTVHAIGPGVVLLETQQTSDVTYRLYDYGRPRELHLEKGLQVIKATTDAGKVASREMDGFTRLIEQRYFVVDRFEISATSERTVDFAGAGCLVGLAGSGVVRTPDGELELTPGRAVVVPMGDGDVAVETKTGVTFARCVAPV
ncbi:type I phosphomannose isomerase catalytic subunit [Tunturibacter empetritectus]|uniref:Mannose-6-phosphate isomerase n=1 Tax=Tunturiibacter lichenicola TaxID=2051959 RepID=A0A7W8N385_9BACT|nr:type I phosphomannose isomerase catalytic subunit [Edaphobacter lichenicola]MBB5344222.1 mannose-6-phosphate isomerase [Edaphobacter lichenicola]